MGAVDPVAHIGDGRQSLKTMKKTGGYVQMSKIVVVKQECLSVAEGGGVRADVDQDVVHGAVGATYQLCLAPSGTAVHAADDTLRRTGLGVLDERRRNPGSADVVVEDVGIERPGEQSAFVAERLRDENQHVGEVSSFDTHVEMLS